LTTVLRSYGLTAFQCSGKDVDGSGIEEVAPPTFNQGDVISVRVEVDTTALADGVFIREVERFEYILLEVNNADQSTIIQLAIEDIVLTQLGLGLGLGISSSLGSLKGSHHDRLVLVAFWQTENIPAVFMYFC
jgi:hypothetical protein